MNTQQPIICSECWGSREITVHYTDTDTGEKKTEVWPCVCLVDNE